METMPCKAVGNTVLWTCRTQDYKRKRHGETTSSPCNSYPRFLPALLSHVQQPTLFSSFSQTRAKALKKMFTLACNLLQLLTIQVYYIHWGGCVSQVQLANLQVFHELCELLLCSRKRKVPRAAWLDRLPTAALEADRALRIWLQTNKCKHRVDLLNKKKWGGMTQKQVTFPGTLLVSGMGTPSIGQGWEAPSKETTILQLPFIHRH